MKKKAETARETLEINGVKYFVDSLSTEAKQMVLDAQTIGARMQELQRDINIMNIAKGAIVTKLIALTPSFTESK